ncbi:ComF family protein [Polaromonas sp. UC242_47]|uniref:ComF family protein n=1 Tax=Polaromonas sp. UC242_47 TaxID=3374626 RepID=UPI00379DEA29
MLRHLPKPASVLQTLASQCAVCHSWPARRVCAACVARFGQVVARCDTCALRLPSDLSLGRGHPARRCATCLRQPPPLNACFAAMTYAYPWSELVASYKFGGDPAWAAVLAELLLQAPGVPQALTALEAGDWLMPLPLSPARLQSRGFNQAWELVKALARQSGTLAQTDARLLLRIKHTPPQAQLKREARLQNVKGAFVVDPLRVPGLQGRRVLLVDDVMTSGASLFAAAQALRDAGAAEVCGVVFARTE